jgi:hypothetical protein
MVMRPTLNLLGYVLRAAPITLAETFAAEDEE